MEIQKLTERVYRVLEERGCKSTVVSAGRARDLRAAIKSGLESGQIDQDVYHQNAGYFDSVLADESSWARSIIVVAVPQPALEAVFTVKGEKHSVMVPPTYEHSMNQWVSEQLEGILKPLGYRIERAILPEKLLAVRCGLARYGLNNITYVEGLGSFQQPIAFYSDLPAEQDNWYEPMALDECKKCDACTKKCPTGAIDRENFRLHAEKCLTFFNESVRPFPAWLEESWHHCLIGCMRCQYNCPVNKDVRNWVEPFAEFNEEETALLLDGAADSELPESVVSKFATTNLLADRALLARNLRSVLQ